MKIAVVNELKVAIATIYVTKNEKIARLANAFLDTNYENTKKNINEFIYNVFFYMFS